MKNNALTIIALATSIVALLYSIWLHQRSDQIAAQALHKREVEFVRTFAPKIQNVYLGLGITNVVGNAQTIDELFGPYLDVINRMTATPADEEKKKL